MLELLARGASPKEAAEAVKGVSRRTVFRRLADPVFRAEVHRVRGELLDQAAGRLSVLAIDAVATLEGLLDPDDEVDIGRLRVALSAARAVLDLTPKLRAESDFERRLERLEALERERGGA